MIADNVSRVKPLNIASFRNIVKERQRMWRAKRRAYFQSAQQLALFQDWLQARVLRNTGFHLKGSVTCMTPDQKGWVVFYD